MMMMMMMMITDLVSPRIIKETLLLRDDSLSTFNNIKKTLAGDMLNIKKTLADAMLLAHPSMDAPYSPTVDASNVAIGTELQQYSQGIWRPISFFSKRL